MSKWTKLRDKATRATVAIATGGVSELGGGYKEDGFRGITDGLGLTDYEGAEKRQEAATAAIKSGTDAAVAMYRENINFQKEQLDYQKDQYADWKNVYGDIQENMGEYYKNLSGDSLASKQLQAQATSYAQANKEVTRSLAQKGLTGSGVQAATEVAMSMQSAGQRASIRSNADELANEKKMQFLGLGLGQGTSMLGTIAGQSSTVGQAGIAGAGGQLQGSIAQGNIQSAFAQGTQAGNFGMTGDLLGVAGDIGGGYAKSSDVRLKNNIVFEKEINGVNFYSWEWNRVATRLGLDDSEPYGVIAQEIMNIHPDVVKVMGNGYYAIDYSKLHNILGAE